MQAQAFRNVAGLCGSLPIAMPDGPVHRIPAATVIIPTLPEFLQKNSKGTLDMLRLSFIDRLLLPLLFT